MFEDRGSFLRNERSYLMEDLTQFGSNDYRVDGRGNFRAGPLPYIIADGIAYGVLKQAALSRPQAMSLHSQVSTRSPIEATSWTTDRSASAWLSLRLRQELGEASSLTFTSIYSKRETEYANENLTWHLFTVDSTSSYYIDGLTATAGDSYDMGYSLYYNNQGVGAVAVDVTNRPVEKVLNSYLDFSYDINDDWQMLAGISYGDNEGCGRCGRRPNAGVLDAGVADSALDPYNYSDIFNPYVTGPQAEFFNLAYSTSDQENWFHMARYSFAV
ncbi:MAG: hypothetical protein U5K38_17050 [Woeseiaceae bacterium]|nr:hypothetical protein [Woeseiaceae bacterium]